MIQQVKDVGRSIDYLRTRSDIAGDRLAYFGVSMGATIAPIVLAVERRFKTAILVVRRVADDASPAGKRPDQLRAARRPPVLMLNGRDDFTFPVESSQEPLFHLLGTPPAEQAARRVRRRTRISLLTDDQGLAGLARPAPRRAVTSGHGATEKNIATEAQRTQSFFGGKKTRSCLINTEAA